MKRFLTVLLTTLALAGLLCVSVSAASFDAAAGELSAIGMLSGSAGGFDLDKTPTRGQAAIMLVRLYGAENEAKAAFAAGELKCAFADVGQTAAPYVAWLADKGLVSGTSAVSFGAGDPCSAKAYTIFLLRALGYRDNVDFTTANVQEFAMGLGLLDTSLFSGEFLRDDLAALTYQALGTDLKDGSTYLLDSLIKSGAIDAAAAKPITDKIEAYRALQASGAAMAGGVDAAIDAKMSMHVNLKGTGGGIPLAMTQKADAAVKGRIQMILDKDFQMAMDLTVTIDDGETSETEKMEYWLKDGVTYVRSGETAYQMDTGMDMEAIEPLMEQAAGKTFAALLPFIDTITAKTSGEDTVYTLTLNKAFAGMLNNLVNQLKDVLAADTGTDLDMDMSFSMDGTSITYTVDKDGNLKNAAIDMTINAAMKADAGAEGGMAVSVAVDMDMNMDIEAAGKDVKITFPDLSSFAEIIGGADGPTAIFGTVVPG